MCPGSEPALVVVASTAPASYKHSSGRGSFEAAPAEVKISCRTRAELFSTYQRSVEGVKGTFPFTRSNSAKGSCRGFTYLPKISATLAKGSTPVRCLPPSTGNTILPPGRTSWQTRPTKPSAQGPGNRRTLSSTNATSNNPDVGKWKKLATGPFA